MRNLSHSIPCCPPRCHPEHPSCHPERSRGISSPPQRLVSNSECWTLNNFPSPAPPCSTSAARNPDRPDPSPTPVTAQSPGPGPIPAAPGSSSAAAGRSRSADPAGSPLPAARSAQWIRRTAVQPCPSDRIGNFLLHVVPCFQPVQIADRRLRQGRAQLVPCPRHILARHVDDPLCDPVFPVRGRQQFRFPRQSAPPESPGRKKRRVLPQEGRRPSKAESKASRLLCGIELSKAGVFSETASALETPDAVFFFCPPLFRYRLFFRDIHTSINYCTKKRNPDSFRISSFVFLNFSLSFLQQMS